MPGFRTLEDPEEAAGLSAHAAWLSGRRAADAPAQEATATHQAAAPSSQPVPSRTPPAAAGASPLRERLRPTRGYRAARAGVIAARDRRRALTQVPRVVLRELRRPAPTPARPPEPQTRPPVVAATDPLPDGVALRLSTAVPVLLAHDRLSVGLVGTAGTALALGGTAHVTLLRPDLGPELVRRLRPDLVLVELAAGGEPAWAGLARGAPRRDAALLAVVQAARGAAVPVVVVPTAGARLAGAADHELPGWTPGVDLRRQGPVGPRAATAATLRGADLGGAVGARRAASLRSASAVAAGDDDSLALEALAAGVPVSLSAAAAARLGVAGLPGVGVDAEPASLDAAGVVRRLAWLVAHGRTAARAADELGRLVGAPVGGWAPQVVVAAADGEAALLDAAAGGADLVVAPAAAEHAAALGAAYACTGAAALGAAPSGADEPFPVTATAPLAWSGAALLAAGPGGVTGTVRGVAGLA